eukprot:168432-Alexandrium_andersonii.AAC.1
MARRGCGAWLRRGTRLFEAGGLAPCRRACGCKSCALAVRMGSGAGPLPLAGVPHGPAGPLRGFWRLIGASA